MSYTEPVQNFQPTIFQKELEHNYYANTVFRKVVNTKYEGALTKGHTIDVPYMTPGAFGDYDNTADLNTLYAAPGDNKFTLTVDQEKIYIKKIDDIGAFRSLPDYRAELAMDAANALRSVHEAFIFGSTIYNRFLRAIYAATDANITNHAQNTAYSANDYIQLTATGDELYKCTTAGTTHASVTPTYPTTLGATVTDGTAVFTMVGYNTGNAALSASNMYSTLVMAKKILSKSNVWEDGNMYAVVPPDVIALIETSSELTHATQRGDDMIRDGFFGKLAGFKILESNNLTGSGTSAAPYHCILGNSRTINFVEQIKLTETLRLTHTIGDGLRVLNVFGGGVHDVNQKSGLDLVVTL